MVRRHSPIRVSLQPSIVPAGIARDNQGFTQIDINRKSAECSDRGPKIDTELNWLDDARSSRPKLNEALWVGLKLDRCLTSSGSGGPMDPNKARIGSVSEPDKAQSVGLTLGLWIDRSDCKNQKCSDNLIKIQSKRNFWTAMVGSGQVLSDSDRMVELVDKFGPNQLEQLNWSAGTVSFSSSVRVSNLGANSYCPKVVKLALECL
ncbi:hypothetical protein Bca52824_002834 [Brassica carinata]|uniref:Uncharacterized protein n=1 Tax=Brassica carinata TaxID=52824 RepID=A0A8X7WKY4_BRACI|nr:hypothetical protein Bca52824_002834 [Brassica carinata]